MAHGMRPTGERERNSMRRLGSAILTGGLLTHNSASRCLRSSRSWARTTERVRLEIEFGMRI